MLLESLFGLGLAGIIMVCHDPLDFAFDYVFLGSYVHFSLVLVALVFNIGLCTWYYNCYNVFSLFLRFLIIVFSCLDHMYIHSLF